ncbi:PHD finger protein 3 [Cyprinodon tularosa]|uniref:PHD finger protein 3 n=1 Tax=Cyprinodon tularosa TaxID=77115 RepID=UPI0018E273E4|nr:PHD finger protein 3 [Cyprinodon tularosa]XP_038152172.1 PHD finger protein 3 [Cyprinodon tularosa]XP_038152173.1 PHD finger protein 3 [Cyprinodon tularosa]
MDIVDTFNHLIPSDQLDESLTLSQNLECDASNEFGTGSRLEDSLKNMLSDKDPMFGCASTQFNLLENEDPTFHIAGSAGPHRDSEPAGLSGELNVAETSQDKQIPGKQKKHPNNLDYDHRGDHQPRMSKNTLIRGRPGRRHSKWLTKSFLIEKGVGGAQQKKELTEGGRINISDLDGGLWLNPTVILRRLTVTIGGFKIELLPGPSYTQSLDTSEPACFEDSFTYGGNIDMAILPDDAVCMQNPVQETATPENVSEIDATAKSLSDDANLSLGPYVNPNDVQTSNGTLMEITSTHEARQEEKKSPVKKKRAFHKGKDGVKYPLSIDNDIAEEEKTDGKEKHLTAAKTPPKPKQGSTLNKIKELASSKASNADKEHKVTQEKPSRNIPREDLHKTKSVKDKQEVSPLKRHTENTHSEHAAKVQKLHSGGDDKTKPKLPGTPGSATKKIPLPSNRAGDHQGPTKQNNPHHSSKEEHHHHHAHSNPGNSLKTPEEKVKKPEKILQKQKSRNSRSISLEEPELFVPDNAPPVKKETVEEPLADSETVWDGNNCCGLCKKHHNNMFMVGCGRCDDWFHGDCVGLDLAKVREMEEEDQMYVCLKCCEEESKKVDPEPLAEPKPEAPVEQDHKPPQKLRPGSSQPLASGGVRPVRKDAERRHSTDVKEAAHKTGNLSKHETKSKAPSLTSKKPVSVEAIRRSVRDSLKEILTQRLKDSDLSIPEERASEVAKKTEKELFHLYKDTDHKYKNKYRSLMFNLKDTKNNVLFKRVLKGEISPGNLIRMSPEELASKELAAWRQRENRHTIEMIEKEQREVERRPITKITHKGEIEIESQEPMKAPEPVELEPFPKVLEEVLESPKTPERKEENIKIEKDTTSQHKSHLFDLHCKICTGRMAPPVEEAQTKVAKVATTVVRRQSTKSDEGKSTPPHPVDDDLHLIVLEESFRNAKSGFESRSDHAAGREEEAAFLSTLRTLWRGFIHMHSVAKLVTKAFPVSGVLDNLSEDLPDSIQVGGRISPQTVWDYLEKIRATGTKEVCLVRFSPDTEEDEISYTLLYAYFSSRRRFGVVSNNLRQVKDMYLIPLGATEKVPHQLVPFDGPGLESNRPNLLLGLIIRQRPKRDFLTVDVNESVNTVPEVKPITVPMKVKRTTEEEEKLFLSSLTAPLKKEIEKPLDTNEEEPLAGSSEEPAETEEPSNQESQKPLRFLPGVLLGWGGELPPLPDVGDKPVTTGQDTPKTVPAPKTDASTGDSKGPTAAAASRFLIRKKETKSVKAEPELPGPSEASASNSSLGKDPPVVVHHASITLKDKPPDVSTEAFLANMPAHPSGTETDGSASANKSSSGPLSESEKETSEGNSRQQAESQATADNAFFSKAPLSGILKKSSAYSSESEDKTMVLQKDKASLPDVSDPKPVPVSSSIKKDPLLPFHQGYLQLPQARHKLEETNSKLFPKKKDDPGSGPPGETVTQTTNPPDVKGPQDVSSTESSEQIAGSCNNMGVTTSNTTSSLNTDVQNASTQRSEDSTSEAHQHPHSLAEPSSHALSVARDQKLLNERYTDPWERPRNTDDRDRHGRHGTHKDSYYEKKSRHLEREKRHGHSDDDKYRERSRPHGHLDDRHGERRKEKHHSNDYSSHHKDRHRHRRDSDYENGRRSSKDSYSS